MRRGTYSIVARDPASGELGVGVQSHWFAVGSVVGWARPGVGAAATQAIAHVAHGPGLLAALERRLEPRQALAEVLGADAQAHHRQLGVVDASGRAAAHTGDGCIAHAGDVQGEGFSCQANMMAADGVPAAMASAYAAHGGDLAERVLAALEAAQGAGGDVRGCQSASLLVVPAEGEPWRARFDLRVDDHAEPLVELRRLLRFARAYELASEADGRLAAGDPAQAMGLYTKAAELAPEADELAFWSGLVVAGEDLQAGAALVEQAAQRRASWLELLDRLPAELVPTAPALRAELRGPAADGDEAPR